MDLWNKHMGQTWATPSPCQHLHLDMSNVDVVLMYVCIYLSLNLNMASETGLASTNATQIHLLCILFIYVYISLSVYHCISVKYIIYTCQTCRQVLLTPVNGGSQETPINGRAEWCNLGPQSVYNLPNKYRKKRTILKGNFIFQLPTINFQGDMLALRTGK